MFDKILNFFIENYKINYILFFLLFAVGIYSYTQIPKEISPVIEPDSISISGSYSGASVNMLNKMVVQEIEDKTKNLNGITSVSSVISPSRFSISLELKKNSDKIQIVDDVKSAISLLKSDFPDDMDEPSVTAVARLKSLMQVSILSSSVSNSILQDLAKKFESKLLSIKDVAEVRIYGNSERFYEIIIDEKKIEAYGLSSQKVINSLSELSYIFPIGKIEDANEQYYISTYNGKKIDTDLSKTTLNIDGILIALKDIATVQKKYEDTTTLASMNGKNSITLSISQTPEGDALEIAENIKKLISQIKIKGVDFDLRRDRSVVIKDRLNIVISNIILAIILITLLTSVLINMRMAFIIALGIPTSFVLGAIYFYISGYSININSLIGVLIAIGIIVDDAIVVSENIQQYIEKGYGAKEAALLGTKEMVKPVTLASLTTLFSFIPLLMISGKLGEIIQLIPIAFSALILASLIESFIFLPIHAAHVLNPKSKVLSWTKANLLYQKVLIFIVSNKKVFLLLFVIIVPSMIYVGFKQSKFQMFQSFDSPSINLTFKAKNTTTLEESLNIVQTIEKDLLHERDRFFINNIISTAGYRRNATNDRERYPYVGYINIDLKKQAPTNFLDRYVTPYLSFYYDDVDRTRTKSSQEISKDLRIWLKTQKYIEKFVLNDLRVIEKRMGNVKADIRLGVISDNYLEAIKAVRIIEESFSKIDGLKNYGNNIRQGTDEIKLKINSYGENLGITEKYLGSYIASLYLSKKIGVIFDNKELLNVKVKSLNKDNFKNFKNLEIPLKNGSFVRLGEICELEKVESLEMLIKDDGETNFYVYANVDPKIITADEVLEKIDPTIQKLKENGVKLKFKGEIEQKRALKTEMVLASTLAVILIFMSMLYLFNSIRETFIVMSVIPLSLFGVLGGHLVMGLNLSLPSLIGALGLAGVIVNDGILMMSILKTAKQPDKIFTLATRRFRPIIITSVTTLIGLSSLIFFASSESVTFQPLAVSVGFGLLWGTILNLFYVPSMYNLFHQYKIRKKIKKSNKLVDNL